MIAPAYPPHTMTSNPRPKTIQIFLPDGNPRSVRIAEVTNRTVPAVEVPRTKLDVAAGREEVRHVVFPTQSPRYTSRLTAVFGV